jgi:hypothetical protein
MTLPRWKFALAMAFALVMAGCATGPKYSELASKTPQMKADEGRIYFYRSSSMMGAAIQPEVRLNGKVVGNSKPGGYFYVDRPAGAYVASASTETEKTASFNLDAGETKYVKTSPSFGVLVGRVVVTLESPTAAKAELASLSYTGTAPKP